MYNIEMVLLKEFGRGRRAPQNYKELFNLRHAILRNHIERALGVLKKRFPILKVGTHHTLENQVKLPAAAAILHNIIRLHKGDEGWLDNQTELIPPANFVDLPDGTMMMTARGSPRINLLQSKVSQSKLSPKGRVTKRHGSSSKVRASWNPELEKSLVDLLHDHNTPEYKGQNGWSSDTWNKIVKKFHEINPYVSYTKLQVQEKEKELKRVYKMLKEARQQSGVSWNEKRWMIEAEPELWDNLIIVR
uniref:Uncharacterized protein n=1 Tax=Avena sativa TaxID=4498 RepID=A0ACD6ARA7_AVESA